MGGVGMYIDRGRHPIMPEVSGGIGGEHRDNEEGMGDGIGGEDEEEEEEEGMCLGSIACVLDEESEEEEKERMNEYRDHLPCDGCAATVDCGYWDTTSPTMRADLRYGRLNS